MSVLLSAAITLAMLVWAVETTRAAYAKWQRRRRQISCALCTEPLRAAADGENPLGFWYCPKCLRAVAWAHEYFAKLEKRSAP